MQQTRRELIDDFLGFKTELGDSSQRNLAERLLNRALLKVWLHHPWLQFLTATPYRFSTVAGTRQYALRSDFGRVTGRDGQVRNVTTGGILLPGDREITDSLDPTFGTSLETRSAPQRYLHDGVLGVHTQPAAAGEACEVLSSEAADTTVRVYIEGLTAAGRPTRTQVTLTGTTPVSVGTWSQIDRFGKSLPEGLSPTTELTTSVGTVTLRTTSASTELQTLFSDESAVELPAFTLHPTPDAVYVISVPFMRAPRRLYRDADPLPRFWGNALMEEMSIEWQVARGQLASSANVARPHLAELVMFDNAQRAQAQRQRQPFTGGR